MEPDEVFGGRYRLVKRIGAGGMGEVWRAVDLDLDRDVAIKSLYQRGDKRDMESARRQLRHEAKAMANLDNPYIVKVHDIFDHEGASCLVMEYVRGNNLRDVLAPEDGALPPERAAEIGAQLADALRAVHANDIVHGDVKPGNVLIDEHGTAKLTDFGIARNLNANTSMTVAGAARGTPGYIAPEVAHGAKITSASDMFGLGATVFAAVERVSPYGDGEGWELLRRAQEYGAGDTQLRPFRGPEPLAYVVGRLLARNPDRRPSALSVQQAFEALRESPVRRDVLAPPPLSDRVADRLLAWRRAAVRRWRPVTAVATVLAVAIAATVLLLDRHTTTAAESPIGSPTPTVAPPAAIGDASTVDPCALTDAAALGRYGGAQADPNYGNFDRCDVLVQTAAGAQVDVEAQFATPYDMAGNPSPSPGASGPVTVARPAGQSGECDRYLYLAGGYGVAVAAKDTDSPTTATTVLCAMADTATNSAVTALDRGRLPRRAAPAASLVHRSTCGLLSASALAAAVPGVNTAQYNAGFGGFSCQWSDPSNNTLVKLLFDQNDPLDNTNRDPNTPTTLGGRPAFVQAGGDGGDTNNCVAQVVYRSFSGATGPTEELLYLVVYGSQSNSALCRPATSLAAAASTALKG